MGRHARRGSGAGGGRDAAPAGPVAAGSDRSRTAPGPETRRAARWTIYRCFCVCVLAALPYWETVGFDFVPFDDPTYVANNVRVQDGLTVENLAWAASTPYFANWHPVTWFSYLLDVTLFGPGPFGFHLTNVVLHAACSLLLYLVFRRLADDDFLAFATAVLFAAHPLHVEVVAWISSRKDLLACLFGLLSLAAWIRWVREDSRTAYGLSLAAFGLSLASKLSLAAWPFALLLLDVWPLRRTGGSWYGRDTIVRLTTTPPRPESVARRIVEKLPFLALAVVATFFVHRAQAAWGATQAIEPLPLAIRLANAVVAYGGYLRQTVWPTGLAPYYPHPGLAMPLGEAVVPGIVLVVVTVVCVSLRKRAPYFAVGWFWFLGLLVPTIGLVQLGETRAADRYTYVPLAGLLFAAVWGVGALVARRPALRVPAAAALVLSGALLDTLSLLQARHWSDGTALAEQVVAANDRTVLLSRETGRNFFGKVRPDEAVAYLTKLAEDSPGRADAWIELGSVLAGEGRNRDAVRAFERGAERTTLLAGQWEQLARSALDAGEFETALDAAGKALRDDGNQSAARDVQARAAFLLGRYEMAAAHWEESLRRNRGDLAARAGLVRTLGLLGRDDEARRIGSAVRGPLPIPTRDEAAQSLALAEAAVRVGDLDSAVGHFGQVAWAVPSDPTVHANFGAVLRRHGQPRAAEREWRRAVEIAPNLWTVHLALAELYLEEARTEEARTAWERAAAAKPDDPQVQAVGAKLGGGVP